jgi:hypothetical protein
LFTLSATMSNNSVRKTLAALIFLAATLTASARDSDAHWFEMNSAHFVVLTDSNEKQARHIASQFECWKA